MTRPRKHTVDYFPHVCRHGKTMLILEDRFGNNGYAFWFRLLESLGDSEGHYLDCNDIMTWELLQSRNHLSEEECSNILDLLANLKAIDEELWSQKIIWSQKFVDNLEDLYARRKVDLPVKESIGKQYPVIADDPQKKKRIWCRNATNKAIQKGLLIRGNCSICQISTNIEAHHENYDDPFSVVWLCSKHHLMFHKNPLTEVNVNINPSEEENDQHLSVKNSKEKESKEKKRKTSVCFFDEDFLKFWQAYPKKIAKRDAQAAWKRANGKPSIDNILNTLEKQKHSWDWTKDNGQFIPHAATYINQGRWDDEVPQNAQIKDDMCQKHWYPHPCPYCKEVNNDSSPRPKEV